jgi:hypothetical protein
MVAYPAQLPPTDRLWSFVSDEYAGIDWSAPMLAIQQLSKLPFAHLHQHTEPPPVIPPGDLTLHRILSEEQMRHLLELYGLPYLCSHLHLLICTKI